MSVYCNSILPESVRWLTVKKRYAEAKDIYEKAAKLNKKEIPPHLLEIPVELAPIKAGEAAEEVPGAAASSDSSPLASAAQVLKTPCLFIRLIILCGTWYYDDAEQLFVPLSTH